MKTNTERLRERIDRNMEDFKTKTLMLDDESIYEMARRIAAVEDVHFYMTTHNWVDESEAVVLLGFDNPLEAIAACWEEHLDEQNAEFGEEIRDFINKDFEFPGDWDDEDDYMRNEIDEALEILDDLEEQIGDLRGEYERLARGIDI